MFDGIECLKWTLKNKEICISKSQSPSILHISSSSEIFNAGYPKNIDMSSLQADYNFIHFVFKRVLAARLVDMNLSLNHSIHNEDQQFYLNLIDRNDITTNFSPRQEQTVWPKGFLNTIYSILYLSESETEITQKTLDLRIEALNTKSIYAQHLSLMYIDTYIDYTS